MAGVILPLKQYYFGRHAEAQIKGGKTRNAIQAANLFSVSQTIRSKERGSFIPYPLQEASIHCAAPQALRGVILWVRRSSRSLLIQPLIPGDELHQQHLPNHIPLPPLALLSTGFFLLLLLSLSVADAPETCVLRPERSRDYHFTAYL